MIDKKGIEEIDDNMIFGVKDDGYVGLSLNNKKVNRSANLLLIGGTGTGKTFKYVKPNLLQENCSIVVTDPSGDIFDSFAPYLLSRGYNVFLFNVKDPTYSNNYNPLMNVYDTYGEISERQVNILVNLYMKNAKAGKEAGSSDPFWDKAENAFMTALIYYVLESDEFGVDAPEWNKDLDWENGSGHDDFKGFGKDWTGERKGEQWDKCFSTVLKLVQMAKVDDESNDPSPLTLRMNAFFERMNKKKLPYKCKLYYDTFCIAPQKTANTILITTAVDLQVFATKEIDNLTRTNREFEEMNINIDKVACQQSYLFLSIPQSHQAYNFLIAMLYSQLYNRLYELGETTLKGKWHIGYHFGTPVFDYFNSKEEAIRFYEGVTKDNIVEDRYIHNTKIYRLMWKERGKEAKSYKTSILKETLEKHIDNIDKMVIWCGTDYAGDDPALPIHVNFLLDEFKNIGEIPNFLTILSTSRKYRIGSHVVIQDIAQLKTMYKENEHETVFANVDTIMFLGSSQVEDREYIQKLLGKTTINQRSTSGSATGSQNISRTPTQTDLMSIDEIAAINMNGRDDEIVVVRDARPMILRKLNLTEHRRWKLVQEAKKKYNIDLRKYYVNTEDKKDIYK